MTVPDAARPKVFCIGFQKTGTSSMRDALVQLGYRVEGVFGRKTPLADLRGTYVATGLDIAAGCDAVEDMPWPLMFRELDAAFPGSKFILTLRDTDRWYGSIRDHFGPRPYHLQQLTYGDDAGTPVGHEARYKQVYDAHNAAVLDHFSGRPDDLLVMRLEQGDGWKKLGDFLGVEVADGPFVRTNSASDRATLGYRIRRKLAKWGLPVRQAHG